MTEETKVQEAAGNVEDTLRQETAMGEAGEEKEAAPDLTHMTALKKGDIVKGKIVKVEDNQVIVDIGYKYDGVIPLKELSSVHLENAADAVSVGQELELKVISLKDEKETLILSKRAVDSERAWEQLAARQEKGEVFEAKVADVVKGGLVVDVGVRGFVPASMVERHFVEDFSDYKGRTLRLKVKELDRGKNKVILSQKDVLDEEYEASKRKIFESLQVGQVLEGTVQRLTPFGAFVDIGGIDGLVHVSEIAWHHVEKPSDVLKEGDKVKVQVLKLDPENDRISLSMKAVQPGPWELAGERFRIGEIVAGTVKRLVSFGAFVEIAPSVEGLVHISQIAHRHIGTPHEVLKEGQEVQVKILDMNIADKRISLSIKETQEPPAPDPKPERRQTDRDLATGENVSLNNQGMSFTLGEKFGDKLSKLKP